MLNKKNYNIGIVLVNWKCKEKILQCLESIRKSGYLENVLVVDNGSDDGSLEEIRNTKPEILIIENGKNLGFAKANNKGIEYFLRKGTQFIFLLNPDTEITSSTIDNLRKAMEKDKAIGIAGPKIYDSQKKLWSCGGVIDKYRYSGGLIGLGEKDSGQYDDGKEVDFISGTALMVKSEVFENIGLFEANYFMYYEDVEFCSRVKNAGYKIVLVPTATITHKESSTIGKNSPSQQYYMARNHLLFVERNAPLFIKIREMIRFPKTLYEHFHKGEKYALLGIRDYFLRRFDKREYWN